MDEHKSDAGQYWRQLRKPLELELARDCPDTAIMGSGIGGYTRAWAERYAGADDEERRLALSLARGLRDYAEMSPAERKRRAMAAIDLLHTREAVPAIPAPFAPVTMAPAPRAATTPRTPAAPRKRPSLEASLPAGAELLGMPIEWLAPRAQWPKLLANKLDITTVRDLLYHVPRDWVSVFRVADLADGVRAGLLGTVQFHESEKLKSKQPMPMRKFTLGVADDSGEAWISSITVDQQRDRARKPATWSPARLSFKEGTRVFAYGKVDRCGKLVQVEMEDIFEITPAEEATIRPGMRVPLYPLTAGVYPSQVYRAVLRVLTALGDGEAANAVVDPIPESVRKAYGLPELVEALHALHLPENDNQHARARWRLAFEEFLVPQLLLAQRRWGAHHAAKSPLVAPEAFPDIIAAMTALTPTAAQARVMGELEADLRAPHPMNRLLQGDVGSGKTLVAAAALAYAVRAGTQGAIMAPTEILAEQLYLVLSRLLKPLDIAPVLLTGSVTGPERQAALIALAQGRAPVAVGTNALVQEGVAFANLGLAIIDEQHRFGVVQRASLRGKGAAPNTLVMTATPIPRTLALTAYGDLDISVLDELPPGRHPVKTQWLAVHDIQEAYNLIRTQVAEGHQAYVVCPLVEQSDLLQADAATEMATELGRRFPDLQVGLLHGRMKPDDKDAAMEAFRTGRTHILACTTVIEVGVDVANATVMLIHNAERYGLAQLHQLRGRVGRSEHPSTCLLVSHPRFNPMAADSDDAPPARKRLRAFICEQDGFAIAEADLALRGPGEYLGTRQSGLYALKIANLVTDANTLELARQAAQDLITVSPKLAEPEYAELRARVQRLRAKVDQFRE
jgi:ATP-dependent DNA helicase RecG